MVTYDPRGMNWDQWCALTAEQFASQSLGTLPEAQWHDWANAVAGISIFMDSGVPDSRGFGTWQEWALRLTGIMTIGK
jgi:hypothetical protein